MTRRIEGRFTRAAGGQIYWQGWLPEREVSGVIVIAHGYAEHSGRYAHVAKRLVAAGYAAYALDHWGHGRSEGVRSNIGRISQAVDDLDVFVRHRAAEHSGAPVFLLGHSMGAMISLMYVTARPAPLRGLILSGAPVDLSVGTTAQRFIARLLSALAPNLGVLPPLDASLVSRDPAVVAGYDTNPLNYRGRILARTGGEAFAAVERIADRLAHVRLPLLVMHGTGDRIAAPSGARLIAQRASSKDVTLKLYDGLYHEILNEPEKDRVLDDVVTWLNARAGSSRA